MNVYYIVKNKEDYSVNQLLQNIKIQLDILHRRNELWFDYNQELELTIDYLLDNGFMVNFYANKKQGNDGWSGSSFQEALYNCMVFLENENNQGGVM